MLPAIQRTFTVPTPLARAFHLFLYEFNAWWPPEYSWSQDQLREIRLADEIGGLCTEIGPHGFRCDWGRMIELQPPHRLGFTWQISPRREPVPDPQRASRVSVVFAEAGPEATAVQFTHSGFGRHGEEGSNYRDMMDGAMGWDYILDRFAQRCAGS